jgi:hypothetical protein
VARCHHHRHQEGKEELASFKSHVAFQLTDRVNSIYTDPYI